MNRLEAAEPDAWNTRLTPLPESLFCYCDLFIMSVNIHNVQGDVWSKGFKKYNETYYFFRITKGKELDFSKSLGVLMQQTSPPLISNLARAKKTRDDAEEEKKKGNIATIANALIAFTFEGLKAVSVEKGFIAQLTLLDSNRLGRHCHQFGIEKTFRN